jgi:hypothetical protein
MSRALKEEILELQLRLDMLRDRVHRLQRRVEALDGRQTPPLPVPEPNEEKTEP